MYSFLRKPRWVFGHLLALFVVILFVNLGFWQLRRLDQRRDFNSTVEARRAAPVTHLPADMWRRVEVSGRWAPERQVLVRNRSFEGRPGYHVLTPLVLEGGDSAVYVNRGWVPLEREGEEPSAGPALPDGEVTVEGWLRPSEKRGVFGPTDPAEGVLHVLNRADLDRLRKQSPWDVYPAVLVLESATPATSGDTPALLPGPELTERNHLSYAVQWFSFAAIVAIGWPLVLRRHAQSQRRPELSVDRVRGDGDRVAL